MKRKRKSQKTRDRHARNYAECIISVHLRNCEKQGSEQLRNDNANVEVTKSESEKMADNKLHGNTY